MGPLIGVLFFTLVASAQMPGVTGGVDSALIKLFGDAPTFSANVTVQVSSNRVEWLRMPSTFNCLNGKFRLDIDMGQIKSTQLPQSAIALFKRTGTDRVCSVTRLDARVVYIIYPNAQSYVNMPLTSADASPANQKLTRTPLGRETVNGHACVKNHSVVKNQKGVTLLDAVTWNASDLQNFPLRIETKEGGNTTVMQFQQVSFAKPDARFFEVPARYKQFSNPNALLAAAMKKAGVNQKK